MLQRKIEQTLLDWKNNPEKKPLLIKGVRQCGKTYIVRHFAEKNYRNVVYVNFFEHPEYAKAFSGALDVDTIIGNLSAAIPGAMFAANETCIIFDEIQECPVARTSFKFIKIDGRFDVIATGSLLGVIGYSNDKRVSIPVGYESIIEMKPLDFEEFVWANNINANVFETLQQCYQQRKPVPELIHESMRKLFLQYVVVGGMPEAVNTFVATHDMNQVHTVQTEILKSYDDDMIKYAPTTYKALLRETFHSIPRQLFRENKKFQYSLVKSGGRASAFLGVLQWIEDAGIIVRCYNLNNLELPLDGNADNDVFKVYMSDTGLFVSMLEPESKFDILQGNLLGYKGAIFENAVADLLTKAGRKLYYFHKDSGLEIDFVIRQNNESVILEVKAATGNTKSAKTILKNFDKYHVTKAIKVGDYNIGEMGGILTLPHYMVMSGVMVE